MCRQMSRYLSQVKQTFVLIASLLAAPVARAGVGIPSFSMGNVPTEAATTPPAASMPATGIIGLCIVIIVCVVAGALVIMRRDK